MDHFDNLALDCGWVRRGTINPLEPQTANKAVVAHYSLTLLNSMSDFPAVEKFTKLHSEITISRCRFGNNSPEKSRSKLVFSYAISVTWISDCRGIFCIKKSGLEKRSLKSEVLLHVIPLWNRTWWQVEGHVCFHVLINTFAVDFYKSCSMYLFIKVQLPKSCNQKHWCCKFRGVLWVF